MLISLRNGEMLDYVPHSKCYCHWIQLSMLCIPQFNTFVAVISKEMCSMLLLAQTWTHNTVRQLQINCTNKMVDYKNRLKASIQSSIQMVSIYMQLQLIWLCKHPSCGVVWALGRCMKMNQVQVSCKFFIVHTMLPVAKMSIKWSYYEIGLCFNLRVFLHHSLLLSA